MNNSPNDPTSQDPSQDMSQDAFQDPPQDMSQDTFQDPPQDQYQNLSQNVPDYQTPESISPLTPESTTPLDSSSLEYTQDSLSSSPVDIFNPSGSIENEPEKRSYQKLHRNLLILSILIIFGATGFWVWQEIVDINTTTSTTTTATQDYGDKMPTPKTKEQVEQILGDNGYTCEEYSDGTLYCFKTGENNTILTLVNFQEFSNFQELQDSYRATKAELDSDSSGEVSKMSQLLYYVDDTSHYNRVSSVQYLQDRTYIEMFLVENTFMMTASNSSESNLEVLDLLEYW